MRVAVKISNNNNHTVVSFWVFSTDLFTAVCLHFKTHLDEAKFMSQTISGRLLMQRQKENNKENMNQRENKQFIHNQRACE